MDARIQITDWAYLAGFVDGEGTVTISRGTDRRRCGHTGNRQYWPVVAVCNTNKKGIEWIHCTFGGRLFCRPDQRGHRPLYTIKWASNEAASILNGVVPFLRVKQVQAHVVLELMRRIKEEFKPGLAHSALETQTRVLLYSLVKALNTKGRTDIDVERASEEASNVIRTMRCSELQGNEPVEADRNVQSA